MLCFVKIESLDTDDHAELMEKLVEAGYTSRDVQAGYGGSDDCIVVAANTNPSNNAGRVHLNTIVELADRYSCDVCVLEKGHNELPGRDELEKCAATEDYYYSHEMMDSPEGRVCEDYFNDNYISCESCGGVVSNDRAESNESGESYCRSCYHDNYTSCGGCGCELHTDDVHYSERHDESYCSSCYPSDRGNEFTGRSKRFDSANSFGTSRYFGIELETEAGDCSDSYAFDAKEDGSVDGMEFVSRKLRGDAGLKETKDFMASGDGIEISDSCGFHLHMDMSDLSDRERYAVFAAYAATEDYWFGMVDSSRDGNTYCRHLEGREIQEVFAALAFGTSFSDFVGYKDRYYWMNIAAYRKHSTFENRLHHGTWSYNTVEKWVVLNLRFVSFARNLRILAGETVESFTARAVECLENAKLPHNPAKAVQTELFAASA